MPKPILLKNPRNHGDAGAAGVAGAAADADADACVFNYVGLKSARAPTR